jgi:hypothetical protein
VARPIRTFPDSGFLIAAFKGAPQLRVTKTIFNKQVNETRFYEQFFARAEFATDLTAIFNLGEKEDGRGHTVVAATAGGCELR